jgi:hypothetical protein
MLVGLTGRIVRGQAISEYLEKGHQMGAHVILNVENVEGVASGRAGGLDRCSRAPLRSRPLLLPPLQGHGRSRNAIMDIGDWLRSQL